MKKTLIISEKPTAAAKIAKALAERPEERELHNVPYYVLEHDSREVIVVPALGHLFTLKNPEPIKEYPTYSVDWVPVYKANKGAERAKPFIKAIQDLAKDADELINATDFDIEGAVIGYTILKFLCGENAVESAKCMKFSTLTANDLRESYENILPGLDFGMIDSGISRHMLDWYWGMNLSKALTSSVEVVYGRFVKLSVGRVQTPTLRILLEREKEIEAFTPEPYWVLKLIFELKGQKAEAQHETERFFDEGEAKEVRKICEGKSANVAGIKTRKYRRPPPTPFNLSSLQSEAYKCFGYSPARTQQLAQTLYDDALISYPRTSSQKIPPSIDFEEIIKKLGKIRGYKAKARKLLEKTELKPNQGKKEDPAHPAIYPTGEKPKDLRGPRRKLYDLIVKRFLAIFGDEAVKQSVRVDLEIEKQSFFMRGRRILENGWLEFYEPYSAADEIILPKVNVGERLRPEKVLCEEKETKPPARYNQSSIIKEMESRNLGTKATRAPLLQNLYNRKYIEGERIKVTEIGGKIIDSLNEHCPDIVSEDFTTHLEMEMKAIREGDREKEEVIGEAREKLNEILDEFRKNENEIGAVLGEAYRRTRRKQKSLGKCSNCGSEMRIVVSKRTKKRFAGCSSYPDCQNSFPLPQSGSITALGKYCKECEEPMIQVRRKGRRPYTMCINHNCSTKNDWAKKGK